MTAAAIVLRTTFDPPAGIGFTAADHSGRSRVSRPRAADDFATIRARLDELRRERESAATDDSDAERRARIERYRQARIEGLPPPWVPTIFIKQPPV